MTLASCFLCPILSSPGKLVLSLVFTNGCPLPLQLFYKNGQPFPAHRPVGLRVHISHVELAVEIPVTQEVLQEPNSNVVKVAFTVRKAGRYEITVKLGGLNVAYSPYYRIFQPGRSLVTPCHFISPSLLCAFFSFLEGCDGIRSPVPSMCSATEQDSQFFL